MFSTLRMRFGIPGVISVIALVFAMLGGAYAANNTGGGKATASAKGKRGPKGPKGATGPAGTQGPAGANGKDGANGAAGPAGAAGPTGVTGATGATGPTGKDGKQGEPGEPWSAVLPSGETEAGVWSVPRGDQAPGAAGDTESFVTFNFPVPLENSLPGTKMHFIKPNGKEAVTNTSTFEIEEVTSTSCLGSVAEPTAVAGHLCVYAGVQDNATTAELFFLDPTTGQLNFPVGASSSTTTGAILGFGTPKEKASKAMGTWAVTAP